MFFAEAEQSQISAKSKKNLSIPYTKKKQSARSLRMKKGKRHATAHPRTGARLLQPKPNLERKKGTQQLRRARKVRNSAPSHACYDKAELRTRKRLSKRARLLQPKPNLERKKIRARLPPGKEGAPPRTGARLLQPKPNLERKKIRKRLDPLGERRYFFPTHRKTMGKMRNPPFFGALLSGGEITVMR